MKRESVHATKGFRAVDGAGVNLVRVLGNQTTDKYDPFLMLDSFDSVDPNDYILGFPTHPHRGMETITYLSSGSIQHEDSMGNKGLISGGGVQWMSAGSGILHSEMPQASDRMLGVQIWLNIPAAEKMSPPTDRKSTRLNSSHANISYAVFCLKKKKYIFSFLFFSSYSIQPLS